MAIIHNRWYVHDRVLNPLYPVVCIFFAHVPAVLKALVAASYSVAKGRARGIRGALMGSRIMLERSPLCWNSAVEFSFS